MAIQFTDFSKAPLQGSPIKDIFENVLKGYQMQQEPAKMAEEQKQRQLANAMQSKALEHYDEKAALDKDYKTALMQKALRGNSATATKAYGKLANFIFSHPNATQEEITKFADTLSDAELKHLNSTTDRSNKLTETQGKRDATPITKIHMELGDINKGIFPGTKEKISPKLQDRMRNDLLLKIVKDTTDPAMRAQLKSATDLNITLGSIDSKKLTQYSGIVGQADKIGDSILEGLGKGSQEYQDYQSEVAKANAAAKQMRLYLKTSIQPSEREALEKLTNPEAWNVSPKQAEKNFNFMRDLMKKETNTLVRQANDPNLYRQGDISNNPPEEKKVAPDILHSVDGFTTIRNGNKTLKIPDNLVDKYMMEHSSPEYGVQNVE